MAGYLLKQPKSDDLKNYEDPANVELKETKRNDVIDVEETQACVEHLLKQIKTDDVTNYDDTSEIVTDYLLKQTKGDGITYYEESPTTVAENHSKYTKRDDINDTVYGWVVVCASFIAHVFFFGINLSFGELYIPLLDYYGQQRGETAWIGSIPSGLTSFIAPVAGYLTDKYGCRVVMIIGATLASSGFILSSIVSDMVYLYVTYGVLVGCGLGLMFLPSKVIVNQHICKRRALANGLCSSGGGVGTVAIATMYRALLYLYYLKGTFLITGAVVLNAAVCGAIYRPTSRDRTPSKEVTKDKKKSKKRLQISICENYKELFHNRRYCVFVACNFLAAMGVFVPYAHLPKRARDLGLPEHEIAWFLPLIGSTSVAGRLLFGWIGDFESVNIVVLWSWSAVICGVSLVTVSVFTSFPPLVTFTILYGIFVGVWTGLKTVVVVDIVGLRNLSNALGVMMFFQGAAAFIGSPLAGWLHDMTGDYSASFYTAGGLLVISGAMMVVIIHLQRFIHAKSENIIPSI